jgi:hypothetical protein
MVHVLGLSPRLKTHPPRLAGNAFNFRGIETSIFWTRFDHRRSAQYTSLACRDFACETALLSELRPPADIPVKMIYSLARRFSLVKCVLFPSVYHGAEIQPRHTGICRLCFCRCMQEELGGKGCRCLLLAVSPFFMGTFLFVFDPLIVAPNIFRHPRNMHNLVYLRNLFEQAPPCQVFLETPSLALPHKVSAHRQCLIGPTDLQLSPYPESSREFQPASETLPLPPLSLQGQAANQGKAQS